MKKYWKARAASRLTRYSISQINICQGLFSLAVLFFDTQRTSFWVLGLLFPHHRAHLFPFLCTEYIHFYFLEQVLQRESSFWGRGKRLCMPYGHLEPAGCIVPAVRPALRPGSGRAGDGRRGRDGAGALFQAGGALMRGKAAACEKRAALAVTGGSASFALRPRLSWERGFSALFSPFFPLLHTSLSHFLFTIFL